VTAFLNPRKAVGEGSYDGSVIGAIGLNVLHLMPSFFYALVRQYRSETQITAPVIFTLLVIIALALLWINWICPIILLRRLCQLEHKQLTKRERRERKTLPQTDRALCRRMILCSSLFGTVICQPFTICSMFFEFSIYINIIDIALYFLAGMVWVYMAVHPKYLTEKGEAIKMVLTYEVLRLASLLVLGIILAVVAGLILA